MRAIVIEGGKGPAEALKLGEAEDAKPGPGQILIRVEAAGVNRPDIIQRNGFYPPPPGAPPTLGLEVAGEVIHGAGRWKTGDRVCALLGGGGSLKLGETLLVHGATSGIGVAAIQMGKAAGAKVIGTARGRVKAEQALT